MDAGGRALSGTRAEVEQRIESLPRVPREDADVAGYFAPKGINVSAVNIPRLITPDMAQRCPAGLCPISLRSIGPTTGSGWRGYSYVCV